MSYNSFYLYLFNPTNHLSYDCELNKQRLLAMANIDFTENYLKEHVPGIGMIRPQASYLVFLDCRALGLPQEKLARLFAEKAHLALNDGTMFGKPGEGFMRLNVGCPRSVLQKALEQLSAAVKEEMAKG